METNHHPNKTHHVLVGTLAVVVVIATACVSDGSTANTFASTTSAIGTTTTTTQPPPPTTTTTTPGLVGGHLVKMDMETLEPIAGLPQFPFPVDSWNLHSDDGSIVVNFEYDQQGRLGAARAFDVDAWEPVSEFDLDEYASAAIDGRTLYTYHLNDGRLAATDLDLGTTRTIGEWRRQLSIYYDLQILSDERIAAIAAGPSDHVDHTIKWSLFTYEIDTGETHEYPIGEIERITDDTGIFDGDYEVPRIDSPGIVWGNNQLFIVHAEGPAIAAMDFDTGAVESHVFDQSTWLDRLVAFWIPTATAKGPSLGIYTSAALSTDGRFLFVSGNQTTPLLKDDGTLAEESRHLGLTVIDTENWEVAVSPDLPIQFVRGNSGSIFGIDTTSTQPWEDDYYVLAIHEEGGIGYWGPFPVGGGGCELMPDRSRLLCSEHNLRATDIRLVDIETGESINAPSIGYEDTLRSNGVLEDWTPRDG